MISLRPESLKMVNISGKKAQMKISLKFRIQRLKIPVWCLPLANFQKCCSLNFSMGPRRSRYFSPKSIFKKLYFSRIPEPAHLCEIFDFEYYGPVLKLFFWKPVVPPSRIFEIQRDYIKFQEIRTVLLT